MDKLNMNSNNNSGQNIYKIEQKIIEKKKKIKKVLIGFLVFLLVSVVVYFAVRSSGILESESGTIKIVSIPSDADVYINNNLVGKSPITVGNLAEGSHSVRIEAKDYQTLDKTFIVILNKVTEERITLKKEMGQLTIISIPVGAEIFLNDNSFGKSPIDNFDLEVGTYNLTLKKDGYTAISKSIEIKVGETTVIKENIPKAQGILKVISNPSGADVYIDGKLLGSTPLNKKNIRSGNRLITIKKIGYVDKSQSVNITTTKQSTLRFDLSQDKRVGSTGILMIKVKAGSFQMGSNSGGSDEKPLHSVIINKDYYIGKYEVTQKQWKAVTGSNPKYYISNNRPVTSVSWYDVIEFCNKLSLKEGLTAAYSNSGNNIKKNRNANGYRLPTEAEWEFAARGGNFSRGYKYSGSNTLGRVGWFWENSGDKKLTGDWDIDKINDNQGRTHDVGTTQGNELGIYDMSGNVWEWCWDWYGDYSSSSQNDPQGGSTGSDRVKRGGGWSYDASFTRTAYRDYGNPNLGRSDMGFRLVRTSL